MNENEEEVIDSTNDTEETVNNESIEVEINEDEVQDGVEDVETLKKQIQTLQAQKEHWRKKANKGESKETTPVAPKKETPKNIELNYIDMMALNKANVDVEDVGEVAEYAKFKGISIAEAIKSKTVQSILNEKREERRTAEATNTTSTRRGTSRLSDEQLLENARQGKMPDSDEDMLRLIRAQTGK